MDHLSYEEVKMKKLELPKRQENTGYERPPITSMNFVPDVASELAEETSEKSEHKKKGHKKHKDK